MKSRSIVVQDADIGIASRHEQDYISLTDMVALWRREHPVRLAAQPQHGRVPGHLGTDQQPGV